MRREYMIQFRAENSIDLQSMAKKCRISKGLLEMLELDDREVTHPNIAKRVSKAYKLTREQKEGLMPEHYRKSSPNYNPDLYRRDELDYSDFAVTRGWKGNTFM